MEFRLSARKRQGEAAEARFLADASARGLLVCKPWGEDVAFDFVVMGRRRFHRVQVKSVWASPARGHRAYSVCAARGNDRKTAYRPSEVDFVAVWIARQGSWYIIPVRALAGRVRIQLASDHPASRRLFERYRERWSLLG